MIDRLRAVIVPPEAVQAIRCEDAIRSLQAAAARWRRAKAAYRAACEVYEQARAEYEAAERELEYAAAEVSRTGGEGK